MLSKHIIPPILQVKNLTTKLQIKNETWKVVDNLSFDLHHGKTLALVGESGCGKSMTALSLMRITPSPPCLPSTGEVIYQNRNLLTISEKEMRAIRGSKIAMIFQDPMSSLNPVYTIGDQLVETAMCHLKVDEEEALFKAEETLKAVGISDATNRLFAYPHQLSGGLKQRVMIAMALICEPDILIADEPTTALDVTIQAKILELFQEFMENRGIAILLITHDLGVVAQIASDVIVMYTAEPVESASCNRFFSAPAHPYSVGLFESLPGRDGRKKALKPISGQVPLFKHLPKGCKFHPRCPFVMDKCKSGAIRPFTVDKNPIHQARCLLHDETDESLTRLKTLNRRVVDDASS